MYLHLQLILVVPQGMQSFTTSDALHAIQPQLSCQEKWKAAIILCNKDLFIEGFLVS